MLATIVNSVASTLLVVALARILDPHSYGLLFLAVSTIGLIQIFADLGLKGSAGRYIAEYKEEDASQVPHIIKVSLFFIIILTTITSLLVLAGNNLLTDFYDEPELAPILFVGVLFLFFTTLYRYTRVVFQGFEHIKMASNVRIVNAVSKLLLGLGFAVLGFGALGVMVGYTLSAVLSSMTGLAVVHFSLTRGIERAPVMESGLTRRILEYSLPLSVTRGARMIDKKVDTILIGFFLNPVSVSYYVIAKQAARILREPANALGFTLGPTFAAETSSGNHEHAARIFEQSLTKTLLLYIPISIGVIFVAQPGIPLIFGEEYSGAAPVLQVFGTYVVFLGVNQIMSTGLNYLGKAKIRAITKVSTATLNLILNVILIPTVGVIGAAAATASTYSLYALLNFYIIQREIPFQMKNVSRDIGTICVISLSMGAVVLALTRFITGIFSLVIVIAIGVLIWGALSAATGMLDVQEVKRALL